jgi:16S rRNA (guanine527-N7)-methyltransferase
VSADWDDVVSVLEGARRIGLLGPGDVERHIAHARAMATVAGATPRFVDLGSGAGVPGLVLASEWPDAAGLMIDARRRAATHLEHAVERLGLVGRVSVRCERVEVVARGPDRGGFELAVSRGFGPPAATAECAAALLTIGGVLVVAEPPDGDLGRRWPPAGLWKLGFGPAEPVRTDGFSFARLRVARSVDDRWPRRVGVPTKRPLWGAGVEDLPRV